MKRALTNPAKAGFFRCMQNFDFRADPFDLFLQELEQALRAGLPEPTAMALATVSSTGQPHARTVLFKGISDGPQGKGFRFFTNYQSEKARDLESGRAALLFHWTTLERQVRVEGVVEKVSRAESEEYFRSRPRLSQLGAWASRQSEVIPDSDWLEERLRETESLYQGKEIPCPPHWGGFRVVPLRMEFWFGRPGRLHERYVFERQQTGDSWSRLMKSP